MLEKQVIDSHQKHNQKSHGSRKSSGGGGGSGGSSVRKTKNIAIKVRNQEGAAKNKGKNRAAAKIEKRVATSKTTKQINKSGKKNTSSVFKTKGDAIKARNKQNASKNKGLNRAAAKMNKS